MGHVPYEEIRNTKWNIERFANGTWPVGQAQLAVLLDIRDELKEFHVNFLKSLVAKEVSQTKKKPKRKKKTRRGRR